MNLSVEKQHLLDRIELLAQETNQPGIEGAELDGVYQLGGNRGNEAKSSD